jgi:tetratricopeptide (TPR) repeat protein
MTETPPGAQACGRLRILLAALILATVAWTTREIPQFGFLPLVDDDVNISFNEHLGAPDLSRLHWMFTDFSYVHRYMPLGWLGFSLGYAFSGLDPVGYHVAGIVLHALNSLLVFEVLRRVLARFALGADPVGRELSAGAGALLWALHPLRVETTSWCSGLLYAQAGFFALLYGLAHLEELRLLSRGEASKSRVWFALGWVAFVASVLTYPVVLFLPFAFVVLDRAWLGGLPAARRVVFRTGAVAATAVLGLALTVYARGTVVQPWGKTPTLDEFGIKARALQAAYVGAVYVVRTLWHGDIGWMPLSLFDPGMPGVLGWISLAFLIALTCACWFLRRRAPYLGVCWIMYLVLIVPNLGLTEHPHTLADRYLYITGIVFSAAVSLAIARARRAQDPLLALGALAALAAASVSVRDARNWRNTDAFQMHIIGTQDPDLRHITAARMGKLRFLEGDVRGGREAVKAEFDAAPSIGGVVLTWKQVAPAGFLSPLVAKSRLQEWSAAPFSVADASIARQQLDEGRVEDALLHLNAALERSPSYMEARFRRGLMLAALGRAQDALHDWLVVVRQGRGRDEASRAQADFMAGYLEKRFLEQGAERQLRALRLERARLRG